MIIVYSGMLKRFQGILVTMASADMDFAQLDAFLTSQMRKRQVLCMPGVQSTCDLNI